MDSATIEITEEQLDEVFGALADRTQRAISQHLKVLERAGLISRSRRGTARLSHLEARPLMEAVTWLGGYREYWEESYERLDELLGAIQEERSARADPGR